MGSTGAGGDSRDVRPVIAAASLLLLLAIVVGVALGRGSSGRKAVAASAQCVSLWNSDPTALAYGLHNFQGHGYTRAEVVRIDRSGNPARRGSCAVAFPSASLDPEPIAAAAVYRQGRWLPLGKLNEVSDVRLAELQVEAVEGANVMLRSDGSLGSLFQ